MDNQEKKSNLSEPISKIFDGVQTLAKTDRVVGEPYVVGDTIIVPFMETSLGFGVGAMSGEKEAGGVGCKVSPFACLVIQNGFSKMIGIKNQNSITKALDMIPDMIDKYMGLGTISPEVKKSIKNLKVKNITTEVASKKKNNSLKPEKNVAKTSKTKKKK